MCTDPYLWAAGRNSQSFALALMAENECCTPGDNDGVQDDVFAQVYDESDNDGVYESVCEEDLRLEVEQLQRHNQVLAQLADRVKRIENDIELRQAMAEDCRTKILLLRQEVQVEKQCNL